MHIFNRGLVAIAFGMVVSFGASAETQQESSSATLDIPEGSTVMVTRDGVTSSGVNGQALNVDDKLLFSEGSEARVVFNPCDADQALTLGELYIVPDDNPCAALWAGGGGKTAIVLLSVGAGIALIANESSDNTSSP
jgi:hypothetical protein